MTVAPSTAGLVVIAAAAFQSSQLCEVVFEYEYEFAPDGHWLFQVGQQLESWSVFLLVRAAHSCRIMPVG